MNIERRTSNFELGGGAAAAGKRKSEMRVASRWCGVSPSLFRVRVAFVADDARSRTLMFPISLPSLPRYLVSYEAFPVENFHFHFATASPAAACMTFRNCGRTVLHLLLALRPGSTRASARQFLLSVFSFQLSPKTPLNSWCLALCASLHAPRSRQFQLSPKTPLRTKAGTKGRHVAFQAHDAR